MIEHVNRKQGGCFFSRKTIYLGTTFQQINTIVFYKINQPEERLSFCTSNQGVSGATLGVAINEPKGCTEIANLLIPKYKPLQLNMT